jgi:hypothetical protein
MVLLAKQMPSDRGNMLDGSNYELANSAFRVSNQNSVTNEVA